MEPLRFCCPVLMLKTDENKTKICLVFIAAAAA